MENESINTARSNERALLGAILKRPGEFYRAAEVIGDARFSWDCYGAAWEAMNRLHADGLTIDSVTVSDELNRMGRLSDWMLHDESLATGMTAITKLRDDATPSALMSYAENVADYATKREILQVLQSGTGWALNGRKAGDIVSDLERMLTKVNSRAGRNGATRTQTITEAIKTSYDATVAADRGEVHYVELGFRTFDDMTGGLSAPDVLVIAGRPGSGKTAWLATVADNVTKAGKRVMIFSLEMDNSQIARRLLAMHSGVSFVRQKKGGLTVEEWEALNAAVIELESREGLYINDMPAISINQMRQELRRVGRVDLVIVDYLQLASANTEYDNRVLEIGEISRGLKAIAKDFNVPVIAAAQLSRAVEQRANKEPQLSDLRESGSIEQDADMVAFIHRKDEVGNEANLLLKKDRNGPVGIVPMLYTPARTRYDEAKPISPKP